MARLYRVLALLLPLLALTVIVFGAYVRLSDAGLVKLFRLLRLARRLLDLESGAASADPGHDS